MAGTWYLLSHVLYHHHHHHHHCSFCRGRRVPAPSWSLLHYLHHPASDALRVKTLGSVEGQKGWERWVSWAGMGVGELPGPTWVILGIWGSCAASAIPWGSRAWSWLHLLSQVFPSSVTAGPSAHELRAALREVGRESGSAADLRLQGGEPRDTITGFRQHTLSRELDTCPAI